MGVLVSAAIAKRHTKLRLVIKSVLVLFLAFLITSAYLNRQYLIDQFTVLSFKPASGVIDLATRSGVNDYGKFLYLASKPMLEGANDFNGNCDRIESTTSILGCYKNGNIYIFNVNDPQLDGIREVTAIHEMLHAAYARLNVVEKSKIDALLDVEYKKLMSDKLFSDKMKFYDRTEAGQRYNELHSVIATEVSSISPELEVYYAKYFSDRQKVVGLNNKYLSVFKVLETKASGLKVQLDNLSAIITEQSGQYNNNVANINIDIELFNNRANQNLFISQSQFDIERSSILGRINAVESDKKNIDNQINQYNLILDEYNSLETQSQNLYKSIDSTLAVPPSI